MSEVGASPSSSAEHGPSDRFAELVGSLREARRALDLQVVALRSVDSTNRLGRRLAERVGSELNEVLLVAWRQTAGRGRVGRSWASPGGLGAYQSLVVRVGRRAGLGMMPLRVGIALCGVLRGAARDVALKWPNDLVTPRGKLGGVLIELLGSAEATTLIAGYGINVGHTEEQLPLPTATSLRLEGAGPLPPLGTLVREMAMAVRRELSSEEPASETLERYRAVSAHRPGDPLTCTLGRERYEGRFVGFDRDGRLLLETANGTRALSAADALEASPTGLAR